MERARGAPSGGTRGVADESAGGDRVARTAWEIRDLDQRPQLAFAYRVGEIVIDRFYDGDISGWRSRGPKSHSIRRLARALSETRTMSRSTLHRCLATYALLRDHGGVSCWSHVSTSHVRAVLPLQGAEPKLELLRRAERERWSVRRLRDAVQRLRGETATASAERPLGEIAASIQREAERVAAGLRTDRGEAPRIGHDVASSLRRARDAIHVALELARRSHRR